MKSPKWTGSPARSRTSLSASTRKGPNSKSSSTLWSFARRHETHHHRKDLHNLRNHHTRSGRNLHGERPEQRMLQRYSEGHLRRERCRILYKPGARGRLPFRRSHSGYLRRKGHNYSYWNRKHRRHVTPQTETGTYTVNPDCTGTYEVQVSSGGFTAHAFFVIDEGGNELQIVPTDPGTVVTCIARKQFPAGHWEQ